MSPKVKKVLLGVFISMFLLVQVFGSFLFAQRSYAVSGAPDVVAYMTQKDVKASFWDALYSSALQVLVRAASRYARDLAYNSAVYVASGGKGKNPLVHQDSFGDYLGQAAGDAVAEIVEEIGKKAGVNLCGIPDLQLAINIRIGLRNSNSDGKAKDGEGKCNWQKLKNGWSQENFERKYGKGGSRFMDEVFATSFKVEDSDFGIAMDGVARVDQLKSERREEKKLDRQEGGGFKSLTSLVSGKILTPAETVKEEAKTNTTKHQGEVSAKQITGLYAAEAWQIFPMAASVFLNTLANEMLKKIFQKGLYSDPGRRTAGGSFENDSRGVDPRELAQREFSFLKVSNPLPVGSTDILQDMRTCPESPGLNNCVIDEDFAEALDIANNGEPLTIAQAMGLAEGADKQYLKGGWKLISPVNEAEHNSKDCYNGAYCYSNLQKLRRQRILPLGFEIAALRSDPDEPPTLQEVVEGFDDCPYVDDNGDGIDDIDRDTGEKIVDTTRLTEDQFKWCRLINPNWILRAPLHKCEMNVYGSQLLAEDLAIRKPECADISTCIYENETGQCVTPRAYGYCLKEENVWRIGADKCDWQNATCKAYSNKTAGGEVSPYLSRTVDYATCDAGSSGCRAYALEQDENGWVDSYRTSQTDAVALKDLGINGTLYLNGKINDNYCTNQNADGCSAFYTNPDASNQTRMFFKKAPDYLGCYDIDRDTPEIDWPVTLAQAMNDLPENPACDEFSRACVQEEVGCQAFTPLTVEGDIAASPLVPGVVEDSSCEAECLGYSAYRQSEVQFEAEKFPMYINPYSQNALECRAQDVGCEEFTDLSAGAGEREAYFKQIRFCEQPNEDRSNEETYYTWEASVDEGQRLRTHRLLQISQEVNDYLSRMVERGAIAGVGAAQLNEVFPVGSPAYDSFDPEVLAGYLELCNEETYNNRINNINPDNQGADNCLLYFDEDDNEYYRMESKTVEVSGQCNPFRKTGAEMYVDENVSDPGDQAVCEQWGGLWANPSLVQIENQGLNRDPDQPVCQRCQGGGIYENGVCIYEAIEGGQGTLSCSPAAAMCREYIGNGGNNVAQPIFEKDFQEDNRNEALAGFDLDAAIEQAAEGLNPNEKSLQVGTNRLEYTIEAGELKADRTTPYEVYFWVRGGAQSLNVNFWQDGISQGNFTFNIAREQEEAVSVGDNWKQVVLGPVVFTGDPTQAAQLVIESDEANNSPYFIDKLSLSPSTGKVYRIKNTWEVLVDFNGQNVNASVPLACDSDPTDGLPGEALGCSQYQFTNLEGENGIVYTTGFDKLCREDAVGCIPVYDTYNTYSEEGNDSDSQEDLAHAYNLLCEMSEQERAISQTCSVQYGNQSFECEVKPDETTCFIKERVVIIEEDLRLVEDLDIGEIILVPTDQEVEELGRDGEGYPLENRLIFDAATIYFPADTPVSTPIYMTARQDFACQSSEVGCRKVGRQAQVLPKDDQPTAYEYEDVYVLYHPSRFEDMLCRADQLGCSTYEQGGELYFKDPKVIGNKLCEYQEPEGGVPGWYIAEAGSCGDDSGSLCRKDEDCAEGVGCNVEDPVPCYRDPLFIRRDTPVGQSFGIFSNQSPLYEGFVGMCPLDQHMCSEFVDPQDTSDVYPSGRPYYIIYNDKVTDKEGQCSGQVSQTEGCVLFDYTEDPNKVYNSGASYEKSFLEGNYGLVDVVVEPYERYDLPDEQRNADDNLSLRTIDANRILKVNRDRQCAEWLECRSKVSVSGRDEPLCYDYGVCNARNKEGTECTSWVKPQSIDEGLQPLDYLTYVTRNVSWSGLDYTGYSLYNRRQIPNLKYFITLKGMDKTFTAYQVDHRFFAGEGEDEGNEGFSDRGCVVEGQDKINWMRCGPDWGGRCYQGDCLYPVGDNFPENKFVSQERLDNFEANEEAGAQEAYIAEMQSELLPYLVGSSCKSYPEQDSPFASYVAQETTVLEEIGLIDNTNIALRRDYIKNIDGYEKVNVCQKGECSCAYNKITYGDELAADYWPLSSEIPPGKCSSASGGDVAGRSCYVDSDCTVMLDQGRDQLGREQELLAVPGICNRISRKETRIGVEGYCLEHDYSRPIDLESRTVYPCLTWMPLQVSAASTDTNNANTEAGYFPNTDAKTSRGTAYGEVYCLDGSSLGSYSYDGEQLYEQLSIFGSMYSGNLFNDEPRIVNTYRHLISPEGPRVDLETSRGARMNLRFMDDVSWQPDYIRIPENNEFNDIHLGNEVSSDDSGIQQFLKAYFSFRGGNLVGLRDIHENCSNNGDRKYRNNWNDDGLGGYADIRAVVCSGEGPQTKGISTVLQLWAWEAIGSNAVLLRNEAGGLVNPPGGADFYPMYEYREGDEYVDIDSVFYPTGLYPSNIALSQRVGDDERYETDVRAFHELGVVMHPPRTWTNTVVTDYRAPFRQVQNTEMTGDNTLEELFRYYEDHKVNGKYLSPEAKEAGAINDIVYISALESTLNERDIQRVYFVPTHYSGKVREKTTPVMYSKEYVLDFERLQSISSNALMNFVPVIGETRHNVNVKGSKAEKKQNFKWWTYILRADDPDGILSYKDYRSSGYRSNNFEAETSERNRIHKRYVGVFGDNGTIDPSAGDHEPEFLKANTLGRVTKPTTDSDPFTAPCKEIEGIGNFWVVGMDFNKDGEFLGYISRFCAAEKNDYQQAMGVGVVVELYDKCMDFGGVYDSNANPISGHTNKAWTNTTWEGSNPINYRATNRIPSILGHQPNIGQGFANPPFGSLPLSYRDLNYRSSVELNKQALKFPDYNGLPYNCQAPLYGNVYIGENAAATCSQMFERESSFSYPSAPFAYLRNVDRKQGLYLKLDSQDRSTKGVLKGLFAQVKKRFLFNQNNELDAEQAIILQRINNHPNIDQDQLRRQYPELFEEPTFIGTEGIDVSGLDSNAKLYLRDYQFIPNLFDADANPEPSRESRVVRKVLPPQVYGLNPATCGSANTDRRCTAGTRNTVSINGRTGLGIDYDGDGVSPDDNEDKDANFFIDPMIYRGSAPARLQFFAFADHDAMPIRQVRVDWTDGSDVLNENKVGLYKNQKPYCSYSSFDSGQKGVCFGLAENDIDAALQLFCDTDSDCPVEFWSSSDPDQVNKQVHQIQSCVKPENPGESIVDYFGDSTRACNEGFFQFEHIYTCSRLDAQNDSLDWVETVRDDGTFTDEELRKLRDHDISLGDRVCVFKPKVQVKDNWGWCNGLCDTDYNSDERQFSVADGSAEFLFDYPLAQIQYDYNPLDVGSRPETPYRFRSGDAANALYYDEDGNLQFQNPSTQDKLEPLIPVAITDSEFGLQNGQLSTSFAQLPAGYEGCWNDFRNPENGDHFEMCERGFTKPLDRMNDLSVPFVEFAGKIIVIPQ